MAKLTDTEVKKVARLAKLALTQKEVEKFQHQLSSIVDYVAELSNVNTNGIEPTHQTTNLENVFREDKIDVTRVLTSDEALSEASNIHNNFFVVPMLLVNKHEKKNE